MKWSWDQGRLQYFRFDNLKAIARTLVQFDNAKISSCEFEFRQQLVNNTGMPFKPIDYTVLRNYRRVFESALLATEISKHLRCSDICYEIAKTDGRLNYVDEYFSLYIPRFRYPSPAFEGYVQTSHPVYPFCAILKYLITRLEHSLEPRISSDDVLNILIANGCMGNEDSNYFWALTPKEYLPLTSKQYKDENRQAREMLSFMSQMSILKKDKDYLYLDVVGLDELATFLHKISTPFGTEPAEDENEEFFNQSKMDSTIKIPSITNNTLVSDDYEFVEGKRTRVEHLRIERSRRLRQYYIKQHPKPVCQMCNIHMNQRYPWTSYLLEIHHLLPLSSPLAISKEGRTSLKDVVGLCPSCHRGLHIYYKQWLDERKLDDFSSKEEVMSVFLEAKGRILG